MCNIYAAKNLATNKVVTKLAAEQRAKDIKARLVKAKQGPSLGQQILAALKQSFN